jgi:hypothetical protein
LIAKFFLIALPDAKSGYSGFRSWRKTLAGKPAWHGGLNGHKEDIR